jgi:hypothetical protein
MRGVAMPKIPLTTRLSLAVLLLLTTSNVAPSQGSDNAAAPAAQPVISDDSIEDFIDLNRNLESLRERISKVREIIARNEDPNAPANQRAAFQKSVSGLLVSLGDDGEIAKFGKMAMDFVNNGLAAAQQDTNFPPEQRDALVTRWRRMATQTEAAVDTLEATRRDLADKLTVLRSKADFVDQMEKLKQARAVLDAIADLGDQRQAVSERLRDLLQGKAVHDSDM